MPTFEPETLGMQKARSEPPASESPSPTPPAEPSALLEQIDQRLQTIDRRLETLTRERQHREYSPGLILGVAVQFVAVGVFLIAIYQLVAQAALATQLVTLLLAGVLQLGALSAFVVGTSRR